MKHFKGLFEEKSIYMEMLRNVPPTGAQEDTFMEKRGKQSKKVIDEL